MEKRLLQFIALVFGLIFLLVVWRPFWRLDLNEAPKPKSDERIVFQIDKGSSAKRIAKELRQEKLIVSYRSFLRAVKKEDLSGSLRYGKFVLSPNMTLRDTITVLTTQGSGERAITIIEGWTINDIDAALTDQGIINEGEFRLCIFNCSFDYDFLVEDQGSLEGFLFPDTYFIDESSFNVESFINQLLSNFDQKLTDEMIADIEAQGNSIYETIIVASMLEKEVRTEHDIPVVSGIIWKRLFNDWTLGIDATLLYVQNDNELSAADLAQDTPYNTRINKGLPPSAIGNPGLASINGAIYPEESEYWFYLNEPKNGAVIYAVTNEEHEQNKTKYLR